MDKLTLQSIVDVNLVLIIHHRAAHNVIAVAAETAGFPPDAVDDLPEIVQWFLCLCATKHGENNLHGANWRKFQQTNVPFFPVQLMQLTRKGG